MLRVGRVGPQGLGHFSPEEQWPREAGDSEITQGAVRGPPRALSRPAGRSVPEGAPRQAGRRRPGTRVATWTEPRELG